MSKIKFYPDNFGGDGYYSSQGERSLMQEQWYDDLKSNSRMWARAISILDQAGVSHSVLEDLTRGNLILLTDEQLRDHARSLGLRTEFVFRR